MLFNEERRARSFLSVPALLSDFRSICKMAPLFGNSLLPPRALKEIEGFLFLLLWSFLTRSSLPETQTSAFLPYGSTTLACIGEES